MLQYRQMAGDKVSSSRKWYKVFHIVATNRCFALLSPAMTSSCTLSLDARSSDCGCHLELVTAECAQGLPVSLSSLWRLRKCISPTACAHISHLLSFMPHHSCRLPQSTIQHMKPGRLNKHDQPSHSSLFRDLKVLCCSKYDSGGSYFPQYDILNWGASAGQHICNSNFRGLHRTFLKLLTGMLQKTSNRKLSGFFPPSALSVSTAEDCWNQ